jgi:hypothetical protein
VFGCIILAVNPSPLHQFNHLIVECDASVSLADHYQNLECSKLSFYKFCLMIFKSFIWMEKVDREFAQFVKITCANCANFYVIYNITFKLSFDTEMSCIHTRMYHIDARFSTNLTLRIISCLSTAYNLLLPDARH